MTATMILQNDEQRSHAMRLALQGHKLHAPNELRVQAVGDTIRVYVREADEETILNYLGLILGEDAQVSFVGGPATPYHIQAKVPTLAFDDLISVHALRGLNRALEEARHPLQAFAIGARDTQLPVDFGIGLRHSAYRVQSTGVEGLLKEALYREGQVIGGAVSAVANAAKEAGRSARSYVQQEWERRTAPSPEGRGQA